MIKIKTICLNGKNGYTTAVCNDPNADKCPRINKGHLDVYLSRLSNIADSKGSRLIEIDIDADRLDVIVSNNIATADENMSKLYPHIEITRNRKKELSKISLRYEYKNPYSYKLALIQIIEYLSLAQISAFKPKYKYDDKVLGTIKKLLIQEIINFEIDIIDVSTSKKIEVVDYIDTDVIAVDFKNPSILTCISIDSIFGPKFKFGDPKNSRFYASMPVELSDLIYTARMLHESTPFDPVRFIDKIKGFEENAKSHIRSLKYINPYQCRALQGNDTLIERIATVYMLIQKYMIDGTSVVIENQ